jgi:hypothetical protein
VCRALFFSFPDASTTRCGVCMPHILSVRREQLTARLVLTTLDASFDLAYACSSSSGKAAAAARRQCALRHYLLFNTKPKKKTRKWRVFAQVQLPARGLTGCGRMPSFTGREQPSRAPAVSVRRRCENLIAGSSVVGRREGRASGASRPQDARVAAQLPGRPCTEGWRGRGGTVGAEQPGRWRR